ncbi:disulfide bond formation protein B [Halalkalibacter wakoensis JCM 9140]|uniref:Probable disulfide formation protein n=1 Tax=Halalkalibacter wakoensis JCM 9140 TaxID=1236970 RepID=W4Q6U5_9BACI|nr:disulfide oxidoreductase [Halalkalibacter wakoensis]GAE27690.1 disulfide bond formation protein B [Halalkalibacter wakoensis JCM 9140]
MKKQLENLAIIAWITSLVATLGSLYFSQVKMYEPCTLCWYQRIVIYPIVIIFVIGILKKDATVALYSAVFSFIGIGLSSYHYALQKIPFFTETAPACGRVPCTGQYINWFGFVTIPFLALTAFTIIFICSFMILKRLKEEGE